MNIATLCPRCGTADETINHVLFSCPFAQLVWRSSNTLALDLNQLSDDFESNFSMLFDPAYLQNLSMEEQLLPFWLLWRIWKARNNFIFNNIQERVSSLVLKAKAEVRDWVSLIRNRQDRSSIPPPNHTPRIVWKRPPSTAVKCNYDAAFNFSTSQAFGGWIIRDHEGVPKCLGAANLQGAASPLEAKTKALLMALQQSWIRGYTSIVFEGVCVNLVQILHGDSIDISISNLLHDVYYWATKFSNLNFVFVKREGNVVAHTATH